MDLHHSSKLFQFWDYQWKCLSHPPEWVSGRLEIYNLDDESFQVATVLVQQQSVQIYALRLSGRTRYFIDWKRAGPGNYTIEVSTNGKSHTDIISVISSKLSVEAYELLLDELENALPAAIAIGLSKYGARSDLGTRSAQQFTLPEQMLRLERALYGWDENPGLVRVLTSIGRDPYQRLQPHEILVRWDKCRNPSASRIAQAISLGRGLTASGVPHEVLDRRVRTSVDVYENRVVKAFVQQVHSTIRRLKGRLKTTTHMVEYEHLCQLEKDLTTARLTVPMLDEVTHLNAVPETLTMVFLKNPVYRAALTGYLEFRKGLAIRNDEPRLDAPLNNLPFLYQSWCVLKTIEILLDELGSCGYSCQEQNLIRFDNSGLFVRLLPGNLPALVLHNEALNKTIRLLVQPSYGTGEVGSTTFEQRPDIVIEVRSKVTPILIVFDAKYKLDSDDGSSDGPIKADIDKMHAYRDSIRTRQGISVVGTAAILYPGSTKLFGDGIGAIQAYPGVTDTLKTSLRQLLRQVGRVCDFPLQDLPQ